MSSFIQTAKLLAFEFHPSVIYHVSGCSMIIPYVTNVHWITAIRACRPLLLSLLTILDLLPIPAALLLFYDKGTNSSQKKKKIFHRQAILLIVITN